RRRHTRSKRDWSSDVCSSDLTRIPRVEGEFSYNQKSGKNNYMFWLGGLWQSTSDSASGGQSISSIGGTAGIKAGMSDLSIVVSEIGRASCRERVGTPGGHVVV